MGMEQVGILVAIPASVFVLLALTYKLLPRGGDFLVVLAFAAMLLVSLGVAADYLGYIHDGHFEPHGANAFAFDWINIANGHFLIQFSTWVDSITVVMIVVVSTVALMVAFYSMSYMHGEPRYGWYFGALSLFVMAMMMLVVSGNLLQLYVAWEGVGLASFLLIGFYWERQSAAEAAKKAFITTRVGDVGLLIGIVLLWRDAGTFDIQGIIEHAKAGGFDSGYLTAAMVFLFMGAAGKSAQFPFHVWLPDAMEGPTPASALIHAATMVVAGVYLVARMMPVYNEVLLARDIVLYTGLITAIMAATMGLVASDIKRVLAFSTVSQLGFMFVALGFGEVGAAMFHLFTHAFFKALLFLCSGSVIHATHQQVVEELGGLRKKMPITSATFIIGSLALAGIIPLAGFWSKDEILHVASVQAPIVYVLLASAAVLTAIYTTRLVLLTFFGAPRNHHAYDHAHESPFIMTAPLVILAALATVAGFVIFDPVGQALGFPGGILATVYVEHPHHFEFDPAFAATAVGTALAGIGIGFAYWWGDAKRAERARGWAPELHALLVNRYYIDDLYQAIINRVVLGMGNIIALFENRVVNQSGVDGGAQTIGWFGLRLKFLQTGRIPNYALAMAVGVVLLAVLASQSG